MTVFAAALLYLSACSPSAPTAVSSTPAVGGGNASTAAAPSTTAAPSASAVQVMTDPCQVMTQSEASTLAGVPMPAGVKQPYKTGGAMKCGYTSGSTQAFVILAQAATPDQAQATWNADKASLQQEVQAAGIAFTSTSVPGIGDQAAVFVGSATINGVNNTMTAIFVLKGTTFVDIGDIALKNAKPATTAAVVAQAKTSVGRV